MHTCTLPLTMELGDERTCYCGQKWRVVKVKAHWKIMAVRLWETELEWQRIGVDTDAQK